ncbi:MAG: hypothetical protein KGV43_02080, partial [Arcobacter sp.]|nr:hypothetical protein [Arcobacter sp.]
NKIKEEDEDNNEIDVEAIKLPDLIITNVSCDIPNNTSISIDITLKNIGQKATDVGYIYISSNGPSFNENFYDGDLKPGESGTISTFGDCILPLIIKVDPEDKIKEEDEDNNSFTRN